MAKKQNRRFQPSGNLSSKVNLGGSLRPRRTLVMVLVISGMTLGILGALNIAGLRARVLARLLRTANRPVMVCPPADFQPQVPHSFKVSIFAQGFIQPRWIAVAPDGDIFVADSAAAKVFILHAAAEQPVAESRDIFADDLNLPFGIAFHDDYVYVADTDAVLRFHYDPRTSNRVGTPEDLDLQN